MKFPETNDTFEMKQYGNYAVYTDGKKRIWVRPVNQYDVAAYGVDRESVFVKKSGVSKAHNFYIDSTQKLQSIIERTATVHAEELPEDT